MPALSVVICTRDRGSRPLDAVRTVLACEGADFEALVVDQSLESATADAFARLSDPRLRFIRTATRGLSRARNLGMRLARSPIVAMIDDDCTVEPSFADDVVRAFGRDHRIGLVFGNVVPAPLEASGGFIPGYWRSAPTLALTLGEKTDVEGMGACMAFRRQAILDLGGFDERLGAGSALFAGEDVDITLRALAVGFAVYETPDVHVVHHRLVAHADAPALVRAYWTGAGAAIGKHIRGYPIRGHLLLGQLAHRFFSARSRVARSFGGHASHLARVRAFVSGLVTGLGLADRREPLPEAAGAPDRGDTAIRS